MRERLFARGSSRLAWKFLIDVALFAVAAVLAFALHGAAPGFTSSASLICLAVAFVASIVVESLFRLHRQSWHRIGLRDAIRLAAAVGLWTAAFALVCYGRVPVAVAVTAGFTALVLTAMVRAVAREVFQTAVSASVREQKRVLIVGAGEAGTMIVREMLRHSDAGLQPVGYLDDDPSKSGQSFVGVPVFGGIDRLPEVVENQTIDQILISIPSAPGSLVQRVVALARESGVSFRIIPGIHDILSGSVSISNIRNVEIEDLLNRDPVRLELDRIAGYLADRVVLVSGAGGSIGSEIVVQLSRFNPRKVVLLGRGENSLYDLERMLERDCPHLAWVTEVADVRRRDAIEAVFARHAPEVVFHAAAHKHVPMMESNAWESVFNNVGGTQNLVRVAKANRVRHFVNISTDKAVNPASIMGATKRVAEYLVQEAARDATDGESYVSVRFGNVLGSRGSVIPLFQDQIRRGGPITLTHPDMTRYFMTIPEAAQLVMQAGGMNGNGTVYVLDMGEPVKILDLAQELVRLSGLVPDEDIAIIFRGMRPGEKLFEQLLTAEEGTTRSLHEKIFVATKTGFDPARLEAALDELFASARGQDRRRIVEGLRKLVPSFKSGADDAEPDTLHRATG